MTQISQIELEQKLSDYRKAKLKPGEWANSQILLKHVDNLRTTDLALAVRILQRVRNLKPDSVTVKSKINQLNKELRTIKPDSMVSSSAVKLDDVGPPSQKEGRTNKVKKFDRATMLNLVKNPFVLIVLLPFLCFAIYQIVWASDRFESQSQLLVQQPNGMTTLDPSMALLSGFTGGSGGKDTELVKAFIASNDLLIYLEKQLGISEHFSDSSFDFFSRLSSDATAEKKLKFYHNHVTSEIDDTSGVISVRAQAFTPVFAKSLTELIVKRSEWYINKIGHDLAKAQLSFVQNEHNRVERKLQLVKTELLAFQRRHNLLDPEAEGLALQKIAYSLESQIAGQTTELRVLRASMSDVAPLVMQAKERLLSLQDQLQVERQRLTKVTHSGTSSSFSKDVKSLGVNEILTRYSAYKVDMEFAMQAYAASQISLEKSRIEAYRQLKFLVVVESPTLAEEARYPEVIYNLTLFLAVMMMIFGIGKIIFATAKELR
jgi:capsular polysaccharide transport system permease protein